MTLENRISPAQIRTAGGALQTDVATAAGLSVLHFHNEATDGANIRPALVRAIAAMKVWAPRRLVIPYRAGGWTISSQVLFDLSDFTMYLYGDIRLTGTARQMTLLFAYDTNQQPAQALQNVAVYGNGRVIDGNATAMTFSYAHGDGSDNTSAIRFNYIDNLYVERVTAIHGPIDSFSIRQCRNWLVRKCTFSLSREDNGFSATTDWPGYTYGNPDTYGWGSAVDCVSYDNQDFGMTMYNVSGVTFERCRSFRNRAGYSCEDAYATPNVKRYDNAFRSCSAYNCPEQGFYIDGDGVSLDRDCKSWNIRGYVGSDPNGLFGHGVVVANARYIRVGGQHTNNARTGLVIFNGSTLDIDVTATGKFNDNDAQGIYARGVSRLTVTSEAEVMRNGLVLVDGVYNRGIEVSNSGGSTYLQDTGLVKIDGPTVGGNGLSAIRVLYVKEVSIRGVDGPENCQMGAANGIDLSFATRVRAYNNHLPNSHAPNNQTFCVAILSSVLRGYDRGNTGDGVSGVVANSAATFGQGSRDGYSASKTWDTGAILTATTVSTTLSVPGADIGDYVQATLSTMTDGTVDITGSVTGSGANNVNIYARNHTLSTVTPASGTLRVIVTKRNPG